jgi:hypothetical protein
MKEQGMKKREITDVGLAWLENQEIMRSEVES